MVKNDLYWLAGFLEGEGSFLKGPPSKPNLPRLQFCTTDKDVACRVGQLLGCSIRETDKKRTKKHGFKTVYVGVVAGRPALLLMKKMCFLMGKRRQRQIDKAVLCYKAKYYKLTEGVVKDIRRELAKKQLTQTQIGRKFGKARETINKIARGKIYNKIYE